MAGPITGVFGMDEEVCLHIHAQVCDACVELFES